MNFLTGIPWIDQLVGMVSIAFIFSAVFFWR